MQLFDTHAHIGLIYNDPIRQISVIQQAKLAGVARIISINNSLYDFKKEYPYLKSQKGIYHAVGVAPSEIMAPGKDWIKTIEESAELPNVVAIGETGLDYCKKYGDKRTQIEFFITQLDLAQKHNKPVIIHNREAGKDILEILKDRIPARGAVFHCYSENAAYAMECLEAGLNVYFSFAGNLTYRNARNLHETVFALKDAGATDRILIETESPFMAPAAKKDERTMPAFLPYTAKFLGEMLEMDDEALAALLWSNSCRFFGLPEGKNH